MGLTQKYKQQTQQVRVITNESNYLKGMHYTDFPLAEGYVRTLINYDIDSTSGKLTPRKGLQTLGIIPPQSASTHYLNNTTGYNTVVKSRVCSSSDKFDERKINKHLQSILYNTDTRALLIATSPAEADKSTEFTIQPFNTNADAEYATPEPFIIAEPEIHGQVCLNNNFFKRPVGTFAFGNSFYTFLKRSKYSVEKLADLPNQELYPDIYNYEDLQSYTPIVEPVPGQYYKFVEGTSKGIIAYYDNDKVLQIWTKSEESLQIEVFPDPNESTILCYSKLGSEIQPDEILLDETLNKNDLDPNAYYACVIDPTTLNPTEAASWGYNMLLKDPYSFVCEDTAVNMVTILGMLPYDKTGEVVLTPRKNQEITLKGYYRAPSNFHTDKQNAKFYSTTKQKITVTEDGKEISRDPKTITELSTCVTVEDYDNYNFGDWWYCTDDKTYYMIVPAGTEVVDDVTKYKRDLVLFGTSKPAASERLNGLVSEGESEIRVKWQIRSAGSADWTDIYNERLLLSEYYERNKGKVPFTVTTTMPENEVLVKLTITDPNDTDEITQEEYILSTNTMGLSLVSDELANTLNLTSKKFDLGKCTGMCEWEQRLVLWGVPKALNTLFISDVGNPAFFPYPNNVDIFTDPIIAVHNYGNELLVLTTSALYRLTWDSTGVGWTHTLVQQNLHVTEEDTYMSCVIKNMFFFKSGEYYYMMVPKTSSSVVGETTIAPISKPITELLDNFHSTIYSLAKTIVDQPDLEDFTKYLVNYFSYVDNTKIVVNYVYDLNGTIGDTESNTTSKYLYVQLIYDTDARTWGLYLFEAPHMLYASHADALQQDRFIDLTPMLDEHKVGIQYYKFINRVDDAIQYVTETGTAQASTRLIKNYQYLDTGNREINTELKKRFREFQFKIKNNDATNLGFYTAFLVDGSLRKDLQRYEPRLLLDETTGEATVIIERVLDPETMAYKTTRIERVLVPARMLQDDGELTPTILAEETDAERWVLNQSAFPGRTLWKIRMPISGKGLTPRVILLSTNEQDFEILGHSWVYRTMNAR